MTVLDEHLDSTAWWEEIRGATSTPIGHLIDGLDAIANQPIPYGWLPGRARTFYSDLLTTWSDLADQTIDSLLGRPKSGLGTVRAILIAAHEAAAAARSAPVADPADAATATRRLLDRFTDYDYTLLSTRRWPLRPQATRVTARQLGVAPVNVQRNHPRAYRRFTDLLADPAHAAVTDYAHDLRRRLGPLTTEQAARDALRDLGLDLDTDAGQMLLHIAGPYTPTGPWLEDPAAGGLAAATAALEATFTEHGAPTTATLTRELTALGIPAQIAAEFIDSYPGLCRFDGKSVRWSDATAALEATFTEHGAPTTATLTRELTALGIPAQIAAEFIDSYPGLRRFDDKWVRWSEATADRAEAALHLAGEPTTATLIAVITGTSDKSVRQVLYQDPRFVRATKQTWALRRWGITEYTGLFSEIAARINAAPGRRLSTNALVDDITAAFPDVAETSIRSYLSAPGFVVENHVVRRRTKADGWPPTAPLNTVRGAYRNGSNEIRVEIPVTVDLLRGSGQIVHPSIATALGVHPGQERTFVGTPADIHLFWRIASLNGASVGSLRGPATTLGAQLGDAIVMVFNLRTGAVKLIRVPAAADPDQRLHALIGKRAANPVTGLARALSCEPEDVAALLNRRGDTTHLALLDGPTP